MITVITYQFTINYGHKSKQV